MKPTIKVRITDTSVSAKTRKRWESILAKNIEKHLPSFIAKEIISGVSGPVIKKRPSGSNARA